MPLHTLEPDRRTLHGHFSRELAPVLEVRSGERIRLRTLDGGWGLEAPRADGAARRTFEPRDAARDPGHALCGPIAIAGAEPGMALEIVFEVIEPGAWGWTRCGGWASPVNDRQGVADAAPRMLVWSLDRAAGTARDARGRTVRMRPFMGVVGMPPAEPGSHSTIPPRACGGNMDCRELVAGSTLYLPVPVPGALLSLGDGHAAQGDGEVSGLAIECPMERVEITVRLRPDLSILAPRAETPAGMVTMGFGATLDQAAGDALAGMLDWLMARHALDRADALALASVAVDLRITQVVNRVVGVHAVLPPGAIEGLALAAHGG